MCEYIQPTRRQGESDSQIHRALQTAGWHTDDVKQCLSSSPSDDETFPVPTHVPGGSTVAARRTPVDAFRPMPRRPLSLILCGIAAAASLSIGIFVRGLPGLIIASVGATLPFTFACQLSFHALRRRSCSCPSWPDYLSVLPAGLAGSAYLQDRKAMREEGSRHERKTGG